MQKLKDEFEKKKFESGRKEVPLACKSVTESALKKRKSCFSPIMTSFGIQARDQLDQEIARIFYTGGLSFNLARNPHYHRSYQFAAETKLMVMYLLVVNCFGEVKDRFFIADLMKEVINEVGHQNVVQIITDNAANCKAAGEIIESLFPHIYGTPCVVHTLNLALKNICEAKNMEGNTTTYEECNWIIDIHGDALAIKHFIMNIT
ncbi:hypothetical protein LIER_31180 [Lithospermum erythrorhizon]|uniref:DUF659 domain-containing protein n=1 Tax=Lithospermum erythrorhizon TaxID=34254 RepID=A0AAV3RRZ6_LITER